MLRKPAAERGATAVEYAILVALIAGVVGTVVGLFGTAVGQLFVATWPW
jgi:Flp pilus assembly pilin Flp